MVASYKKITVREALLLGKHSDAYRSNELRVYKDGASYAVDLVLFDGKPHLLAQEYGEMGRVGCRALCWPVGPTDEIWVFDKAIELELLAKHPLYYISCDPGQGDIGKWYMMKPECRSGVERRQIQKWDGTRSFDRRHHSCGRREWDRYPVHRDRRSGKDRRG